MWQWLKSKKGTPIFKYLVLILVLLALGVGTTVYKDYYNIPDSSSKEETSQSSDNDKSFFEEIHIGWSNIIIFAGLAIVLAVIERKKDKSNESQKIMKFYYDDENEEE